MKIDRTRQYDGLRLAPLPLLAAALLLLVVPWTSRASAPADAGLPEWQSTLQRYARNPSAHMSRRALLELADQGTAGLPPVYQLAVADAYLRSGDLRAAGRAFDEVIAADAGERWAGLGAIGRGWTALRSSDLDEARSCFANATVTPGSTGLLGDCLCLAARSTGLVPRR